MQVLSFDTMEQQKKTLFNGKASSFPASLEKVFIMRVILTNIFLLRLRKKEALKEERL